MVAPSAIAGSPFPYLLQHMGNAAHLSADAIRNLQRLDAALRHSECEMTREMCAHLTEIAASVIEGGRLYA